MSSRKFRPKVTRLRYQTIMNSCFDIVRLLQLGIADTFQEGALQTLYYAAAPHYIVVLQRHAHGEVDPVISDMRASQ